MPLLRAIAARDLPRASQLLADSPGLARESTSVGAGRQTPGPYFLKEIGHYIYSGDTALHIAAAAHLSDFAAELVTNGANPGARNRLGQEPLHYAAVGSPGSANWNPQAQAAVIEYLIRAGSNPNSPDTIGATPLHRAVRTRSTGTVRALVALGADVRRRNGRGSTPLHLAVQNTGRSGSGSAAAKEQQAAIIRLLVEHGARPTDTDGRGKTVAACITSGWIDKLVRERAPRR